MKFATLFCAAASANIAANEGMDAIAKLSGTVNKIAEFAAQADEYPERPCIKFFLTAMKACTEVQLNHPFCKEDDPNFNGLLCAVVINKCLVEELEGMFDCME